MSSRGGEQGKVTMRKVNATGTMADKPEVIWRLNIDQIDEISGNVSFAIAVLDAISVMGTACGNLEIKGRTLLRLASEAEKRMERVKEIMTASKIC
jgi:hypothetical protein